MISKHLPGRHEQSSHAGSIRAHVVDNALDSAIAYAISTKDSAAMSRLSGIKGNIGAIKQALMEDDLNYAVRHIAAARQKAGQIPNLSDLATPYDRLNSAIYSYERELTGTTNSLILPYEKHLPGQHDQALHGRHHHGPAEGLYDEEDELSHVQTSPQAITSAPTEISLSEYLSSQPLTRPMPKPIRTRAEKVRDFLRQNRGKLVAVGAAITALGVLGAAYKGDPTFRAKVVVAQRKLQVQTRGLAGPINTVIADVEQRVAHGFREARRTWGGPNYREPKVVDEPKQRAPEDKSPNKGDSVKKSVAVDYDNHLLSELAEEVEHVLSNYHLLKAVGLVPMQMENKAKTKVKQKKPLGGTWKEAAKNAGLAALGMGLTIGIAKLGVGKLPKGILGSVDKQFRAVDKSRVLSAVYADRQLLDDKD